MKSKELLLKHLTLNHCKGYVTSDGRLYKAIIDALDEALTIPVVVLSDCDYGHNTLNKNDKPCKLMCCVKKEEYEQ